MNCNKTDKYLNSYIDGELSFEIANEIKIHLQNCERCHNLHSELQSTLILINRRKTAEPNPFIFTKIKTRLEELSNTKEQREITILKKVIQPIVLSIILITAIFSGVKLGSAYEQANNSKVAGVKTTEYYLNDMCQERLEMIILTEK